MLLYSRYILKKTIASFIALTSVLICLIWFSRAISYVRYVTENGVALSKFFYLFLLILPWILLFIIPIALFASILITYNRLILSNEITILKNSGLTKAAICRPVITITIICTIICFAISLFLMPYANKEMRLLRTNLTNNYASLSFNPKTFETLNDITIYAQSRDQENNLYGIILHDERTANAPITITARTGQIIVESQSALLYMEDGTIQKLNTDKHLKSDILSFDSYVFNLTATNQNTKQAPWKARERYLSELINPQEKTNAKKLRKYYIEFHQRLTYPLLSVIFAMIALSSILRGNFSRQGNSKNVILAIASASTFFAILLSCYEIIESNPQFIAILYIIIALSFLINAKALQEKLSKND